MKSLNLNANAWELFVDLIVRREELGVDYTTIDGCIVVDCVNYPGSLEAGLYTSRICIGDCGKVHLRENADKDPFKYEITVQLDDYPHIITMGCQYAGWRLSRSYSDVETEIKRKRTVYHAVASGPARSLALEPKEVYQSLEYRESSKKSVIFIESTRLPPFEILQHVSRKCDVLPENLGVICVPTTSIVGNIQTAARVVETGIMKAREVGLDPRKITKAFGSAPVAPVLSEPLVASAACYEAIAYQGYITLHIKGENDEHLSQLVKEIPSNSSEWHGKSFYEIFQENEFNFYSLDTKIFAPAKVKLVNDETGSEFEAGEFLTNIGLDGNERSN